MDQCTHEVRKQYWKNIISQCQQRPEGQTAQQWMNEHGICKQTYYLWQRKIRKETYEQLHPVDEQLPAVSAKAEVSFAEIPIAQAETLLQPSEETKETLAAIIRTGTCTIEIANSIQEYLLIKILQEVSHA